MVSFYSLNYLVRFHFGTSSFLDNLMPYFLFLTLWLLSLYFSKAPEHIIAYHHSRVAMTQYLFSVRFSVSLANNIYSSMATTNKRISNNVNICPSDKYCQGQMALFFNAICVWNCLSMSLGQLCLKILSSRKVRSSLLKWTWSFEQRSKASFF